LGGCGGDLFAGVGRVVAAVAEADPDDLNFGGGLVDVDLVDLSGEAFVVGAERLEDLPDHLVVLLVPEGVLGGDPGGDRDREDDVPELFVGGEAHDPADGLDDVDDALAGLEEQHRVERGDVDAFGETFRVRQDPAHTLAGWFLEPRDRL
jgi:hypothetical protein